MNSSRTKLNNSLTERHNSKELILSQGKEYQELTVICHMTWVSVVSDMAAALQDESRKISWALQRANLKQWHKHGIN